MGVTECIVCIVLAIGLLSPEYLKTIAGKLGTFLRIVQQATKEVKSEVVNPVREAIQPIKDSVEEPIKDIKSTVSEIVNMNKEE